MDETTRMALASAELAKGIGYIKAALSLLSPIERHSIVQAHKALTDEILDIEAAASMVHS